MDNVMTSSRSNEVKTIINGLECDSKKILLGGKVILVPFLGQKVTHLSRILCLPARKSISLLIIFLDRSLVIKLDISIVVVSFYKIFLHNMIFDNEYTECLRQTLKATKIDKIFTVDLTLTT